MFLSQENDWYASRKHAGLCEILNCPVKLMRRDVCCAVLPGKTLVSWMSWTGLESVPKSYLHDLAYGVLFSCTLVLSRDWKSDFPFSGKELGVFPLFTKTC